MQSLPATPQTDAIEEAIDAWQTISTAPKHRIILAVVDGEVRLVCWGKTSHVPLYGFCLADQGAEDFDLCSPTHWQPLPELPRVVQMADGAMRVGGAVA